MRREKNEAKQNKASVGTMKCTVIYLTVRNRWKMEKNTEWNRKEVSCYLGSSPKKSAFGEMRFCIQLIDITDHRGHAVGKVHGLNYFKIPLKNMIKGKVDK